MNNVSRDRGLTFFSLNLNIRICVFCPYTRVYAPVINAFVCKQLLGLDPSLIHVLHVDELSV